jgi:hypothetical protein
MFNRASIALSAVAGVAVASMSLAALPSAAESPTGPGGGLEGAGYLLLDLGAEDKFEYIDTDGNVITQPITTSPNKKCAVDPTSGDLVALVGSSDVGLIKDGLGVRTNGGRSCGQLSGSDTFSIKLNRQMGDALEDALVRYAEVDIEHKAEGSSSCELSVTYKRDGETVGTYTESLGAGNGDCSNDSGLSDNTRVVLEPPSPVDEVVFAAADGLISVHGGADLTPAGPVGTDLGTLASVFELVTVTDVLKCEEGSEATIDGATVKLVFDGKNCVDQAISLRAIESNDYEILYEDLGNTLDVTLTFVDTDPFKRVQASLPNIDDGQFFNVDYCTADEYGNPEQLLAGVCEKSRVISLKSEDDRNIVAGLLLGPDARFRYR